MRLCILPVTLCFAAFLQAQTTDEDLKIYTDHPRLFLKAQRLKMLRRERDRQSERWDRRSELSRLRTNPTRKVYKVCQCDGAELVL